MSKKSGSLTKEAKETLKGVGIGKINDNFFRFPEYKMLRSSEFIDFDIGTLDVGFMERTIIDYIERSNDLDVYDIIKDNIALSANSKDDSDSLDMVSAEISDIIKTHFIKDIKKGFENISEIGIIRRYIEGDMKDTHFAIENEIMTSLFTVIQLDEDVKSEADEKIIPIIERFNSRTLKTKITIICQKIKELIGYCLADSWERCAEQYVHEKVVSYSKINNDNPDESFIISVHFDIAEFIAEVDNGNTDANNEKYEVIDSGLLNKRDLLLSLCTLYIKLINKPPEEQVQDIIKWCKRNVFPYNIKVHNRVDDYEHNVSGFWNDDWYFLKENNMLHFKLKGFLRDLRNLTETTLELLALIRLKRGDVADAQKLIRESNIFDSQYLAYGRSPYYKDCIDYSACFVMEYNGDAFCKDSMRNRLLSKIPKIQVGLNLSLEKGKKIEIEPCVNSVFELSWYALIRIVEADDEGRATDISGGNVRVGRCCICGELFTKKKSTRQKCYSEDCIRAYSAMTTQRNDNKKKQHGD